MADETEEHGAAHSDGRWLPDITAPEPTGPDLTPHMLIWRSPDGWVTFHRKHPETGKHEDLFALPVKELHQQFPAIRAYLLQDAFASVNLYYRGAYWPSRVAPAYKAPARRSADPATSTLRYLCSCYVDMDVGRPNDKDPLKRMTAGQAIGLAIDAEWQGLIPMPTIFAYSGRGAYLFWLLTNPDGTGPHRVYGFTHKRDLWLYKEVNKKALARLREFGIGTDIIHDASRFLRVHGTMHTGAGRPTQYLISPTKHGGALYTLEQLAAFFDLQPQGDLIPASVKQIEQAPRQRPARPKDLEAVKAGKRGFVPGKIKKALMRFQDIVSIEQYHGGFVKPRRRYSLTYAARFLHEAGTPKAEIVQTLAQFAGRCRPPYPSDEHDATPAELADLARSGRDGLPKGLHSATMAEFFMVTHDVAVELGLQSIVPASIRELWKNAPSPRQQRKDARRLFMREYLEAHPGAVLSVSRWLVILAQNGHQCARGTANTDLRDLEKAGLIHRGKGPTAGRPRKTVQQSPP